MKANEANGAAQYQTTDLHLAALLLALGHKLVDIRLQGSRGIFVFTDDDDLRYALLIWANDQPTTIRVRSFVNGIRDLKGLVGV